MKNKGTVELVYVGNKFYIVWKREWWKPKKYFWVGFSEWRYGKNKYWNNGLEDMYYQRAVEAAKSPKKKVVKSKEVMG